MFNLDGRFSSLADHFEGPVLEITLDVRIIKVAANQT